MGKQSKLSEDQEQRIVATLKRIRSGLRGSQLDRYEEPAHLFEPEAFNDPQK